MISGGFDDHTTAQAYNLGAIGKGDFDGYQIKGGRPEDSIDSRIRKEWKTIRKEECVSQDGYVKLDNNVRLYKRILEEGGSDELVRKAEETLDRYFSWIIQKSEEGGFNNPVFFNQYEIYTKLKHSRETLSYGIGAIVRFSPQLQPQH